MSAPVRKSSEPLHLFSVTSDDLLMLIREEYGAWKQPRFQFTSVTELPRALDVLTSGKCRLIDLAIVEFPLDGMSGVERFLDILRLHFPDCPAIISCPGHKSMRERLLSRGLIELVGAPVDMPELVAATCELSRAGRGALSKPRNRAAIRTRAINLLKDELARLHADRCRVMEAIHEIAGRPECAERARSAPV